MVSIQTTVLNYLDDYRFLHSRTFVVCKDNQFATSSLCRQLVVQASYSLKDGFFETSLQGNGQYY